MFTQTNGNPANFDTNTARAIEEITRLVQDVEQRVQYVKLGLLQSFPQMAGRGLTLGMPNAVIPSPLHAGIGASAQLYPNLPTALPWGMTAGYGTYGGYPTHPFAYVVPSVGAPSPVVSTPYGNFPASLPTFRL